LVAFAFFIVGWRVGVWLSDPENVKGLRKLRPHVEIAPFGEGESLGNGAETTRPPGLGDEARVVSSVLGGSGETAVLQVERANGR
jgi:hypothetical protein